MQITQHDTKDERLQIWVEADSGKLSLAIKIPGVPAIGMSYDDAEKLKAVLNGIIPYQYGQCIYQVVFEADVKPVVNWTSRD